MEEGSQSQKSIERLDQDQLDPNFIPKEISHLLHKLENHNHSAYIVGGCVRDWYLGYDLDTFIEKGGDFDITTSATVEEMKEIFSSYKQILDGEEFGTIKLYDDGDIIEITTFRIEGAYRDGRHPEEVIFSDQVEDDLSRRDFTINAMAADKMGTVIDPFDGRKDLKRRVVKTVGKPEDRFSEDYLRMLRAVRFATTLDFSIDASTLQAIKKIQQSDIDFSSAVSSERKLSELQKTLGINPSTGFSLLMHTGLGREVFPITETVTKERINHIAVLLNYEASDWIISLVIILYELEQLSEESLTVNLDKYLTELACPVIDKDHILNLLDQFPLPKQVWSYSCSEINLLYLIWKGVNIYKKEETHEHRFWKDLFRLYSILFDKEFSQVRKSEIIELWEKYPRSSEIEIYIDGNEIIQLGFEGKSIGLVIEELRHYRPKGRRDAIDFVNNLLNFPLDLVFISNQIDSEVNELVTESVLRRRRQISELKNS